MSEKLTLLKTDLLHRVRTPTLQREALLDAFERTSMSGAQFARHHGIRYPTFANWCQKRRRSILITKTQLTPQPPPSECSDWAQAVLAPGHLHAHDDPPGSLLSERPLSVALPGGAMLHLESMAQVPLAAALLRAVQSSSSSSLAC